MLQIILRLLNINDGEKIWNFITWDFQNHISLLQSVVILAGTFHLLNFIPYSVNKTYTGGCFQVN